MHTNLLCDLCKEEEESIQHTLECSVLIKQCPELYNDAMNVQFEDVFKTLDKQVRATI